MLTDDYLQATTSVLSQIVASERASLAHVATWFADTIANDGLVHTFGTGHSSLLACDGLYRAGGLACINAIIEPFTTFESGALAGTQFERTSGLAERILDRYELRSEDTLVVFSNSGVNALPVEVTQLQLPQQDVGALGTALATGLGVGLFEDMQQAAQNWLGDGVISDVVPEAASQYERAFSRCLQLVSDNV